MSAPQLVSGATVPTGFVRIPNFLRPSTPPLVPPQPSTLEVVSNTVDASQVINESGTVNENARIAFVRPTAPASIVIPQFSTSNLGPSRTSRTITIKNIGSDTATITYAGGTIDGGASVAVGPGGATTLSAVPPDTGAEVVELAVIAPPLP